MFILVVAGMHINSKNPISPVGDKKASSIQTGAQTGRGGNVGYPLRLIILQVTQGAGGTIFDRRETRSRVQNPRKTDQTDRVAPAVGGPSWWIQIRTLLLAVNGFAPLDLTDLTNPRPCGPYSRFSPRAKQATLVEENVRSRFEEFCCVC